MDWQLRGRAALAVLLAGGTVSAYAANLTVECLKPGCLPQEQDQTADLLYRPNESAPLTIRWSATENPVPNGYVAVLYAGNPAMRQEIPKRGQLAFARTKDGWQADKDFAATELGRGTFLAIVVARKATVATRYPTSAAEADTWDESDAILDWRAFRLLTHADRVRRDQLPQPAGNWSVDVRPALLRVTTGHGEFPRSRGGGRPVWWSLNEREGNTNDLDIDGEYSGVPGITVQVATAWHTRAGEDWKQEVIKHLTGIDGHTIRFGELEWKERADRQVEAGQNTKIMLRHYYTVVTLFTNASVKSFDESEVGKSGLFFRNRYFAHETTAQLKEPDDPRFWSSYNEREYGSDPRLLALLNRHVRMHGSVPGLGPVQTVGGDGGSVSYHVGFYVRVQPWDPGSGTGAEALFNAGIVGIDVVAARAGHGGVMARGSVGTESGLAETWCQVVRCGEEAKKLDLGKPPDGYAVAPPVASLQTLSGALPMIVDAPDLAERKKLFASESKPGAANTILQLLPRATRTGVNANLRAGALIQKAAFGHAKNVVPINSYAQFVVKITVAMTPKAVVVASDEAGIPLDVQFGSVTETPRPDSLWAWLTNTFAGWITGLVIIVVLVAFIFIPGLREVVSAVLSLFAALINRVTKWVKG